MIVYRFRNHFWIVAAIVIAGPHHRVLRGATKIIRWELEQLRAAW